MVRKRKMETNKPIRHESVIRWGQVGSMPFSLLRPRQVQACSDYVGQALLRPKRVQAINEER